jgi:Leucine-rich repeat (LRR) protein
MFRFSPAIFLALLKFVPTFLPLLLSLSIPSSSCLSLSLPEYYSLSLFYNQLNGSGWKPQCSQNWIFDNSSDPCSDGWHGIFCSSDNQHIEEIHLGFCGLKGTLPLDIGNFHKLISFNISQNSIFGSIPDTISSLEQLRVFAVDDNFMTGTVPSFFSQLSMFQMLNLSSNSFTGSLPSLNSHSNLISLSLSYNSFTGIIQSPFINCAELVDLDLSYNHLYGTLPEILSSCASLKRLVLSSNALTGSLPSSLSNLPDLSILDIDVNSMTGPIPSSLFLLSELHQLNLSHNQFSSMLPFIRSCPSSSVEYNSSLSSIDLSNNYLSGTISSCLGTLSSLGNLFLSSNQFSGSIHSNFFSNSALMSLSLNHNYFTSSLPSSFTLPCLQNLYLSDNLLTSTIPQSLENLINIIIFDVNTNHFTGTISKTLFNSSVHTIRYLYLHNNQFSGTLPSTLFLQTMLQHLILFENRFTQHLPTSLSSLSRLETLLIQGNQLTGLPKDFLMNSSTSPALPFFPHLQALDISNNKFHGTFPNEIFQLTSLRYLSIISSCFHGRISFPALCSLTKLEVLLLDGLQSGSSCQVNLFDPMSIISNSFYFLDTSQSLQLHDCLGKLSDLETLHLSGNKFTGAIPSTLGQLLNLKDLTLSYNEFKGTIPSVLLKKANYQKLDLSRNKLSGSFHQLVKWKTNSSSTSATDTAIIAPTIIKTTVASRSSSSLGEAETSIKLNGNRLSGALPTNTLNRIDNVDVLSGNLFPCHDNNDLPHSDPEKDGYVCGSDDLDFSMQLWLIFFGIITLSLVVIALLIFYKTSPHPSSTSSLSDWIPIETKVRVLLQDSYGHVCEWIRLTHFISFQDTPELFRYLKIFHSLRAITLHLTVLIILTCIFFYPLSKTYDHTATHSTQYRWLFSAAYLSGIQPALFILFVYFLSALYLLHQLIRSEHQLKDLHMRNSSISFSNTATHNTTPDNTSPPARISFQSFSKFLSDFPAPSPTTAPLAIAPSDMRDDKNRDHLWSSYSSITLLLLFNCSIVLMIKGFYVIAINTQQLPSSLKLLFKIFLSFFDFIWGNVILSKLISSSSLLSFMRSKVKVRLHLALLIFNGIIAPVLASLLTDSNCLNSLVASQDEITSNAQFTFCKRLDISHSMMAMPMPMAMAMTDAEAPLANTENEGGREGGVGLWSMDDEEMEMSSTEPNCLEYDSMTLSTSYIPPFTYSYQCTSSILTNFIPVFFFSCIVLTFLFPLINSLLAYLATNNSAIAPYLQRLPGVLFPETSVRHPNHLVMHSGIVLSGILQQIVILLTFGITSPPLALALCFTIYSLTWQWQIFIGRYLQHGRQPQHLQKPQQQLKEQERLESGLSPENSSSLSTNPPTDSSGGTGVGSLDALMERSVQGVWLGAVQSVWTMIDISALFFGVLLFDVSGDEVGWLLAVCCFSLPTLLLPVLIRVIYREYWRYLICQKRGGDSNRSGSGSSGKSTAKDPNTVTHATVVNEIHTPTFEFSLFSTAALH